MLKTYSSYGSYLSDAATSLLVTRPLLTLLVLSLSLFALAAIIQKFTNKVQSTANSRQAALSKSSEA